jgi:hypothetical protein
MATGKTGDLMQALVARLSSTITGHDDAVALPRNKLAPWYVPGVLSSPRTSSSRRRLRRLDREETQEADHQVFLVSKLFDYIPDISGDFVSDQMKQTMCAATQDAISSVNSDVLRFGRVGHRKLSHAETT